MRRLIRDISNRQWIEVLEHIFSDELFDEQAIFDTGKLVK